MTTISRLSVKQPKIGTDKSVVHSMSTGRLRRRVVDLEFYNTLIQRIGNTSFFIKPLKHFQLRFIETG
jgi:hypothetical protein